jgi:hypothetical protein
MVDKKDTGTQEGSAQGERRTWLIALVVFCLSAALIPIWFGIEAVMLLEDMPPPILLYAICGISGLAVALDSLTRWHRRRQPGEQDRSEGT